MVHRGHPVQASLPSFHSRSRQAIRRSAARPRGAPKRRRTGRRVVATSRCATAEIADQRAAVTRRGGSSDRDRGIELLLAFVVAALVMVVAVAIVAVVGRWWVLVPVILVDFVATFAVIASIVHLLRDGGDARV